jgi:hypothetical protein
MIKRFLLLAALAVILLPTAVLAASPWEAATLRLERGMTEQMTTSAVGAEPTSSRMETCGQNSGSSPFTCKIVIYGNLYGSQASSGLAAIFTQTRRGWSLLGWTPF